MKLISALTAGTLIAAGGVVAAAAPAISASGLTTRCNGTASGVTVPGTLVVPRGASCDLTDITVTGDVRVAAGADFVAEDSTLGGRVTVAEDAFAGLVETEVAGRVVSRQGFGLSLEGSSAQSVVSRGVADSDVLSTVYLEDGTDIAGVVSSDTGELLISSSSVGGSVTGDGTVYTDVVDSVIDGGLSVTDNVEGGIFCESEVYGDATYTGNMSVLQLGADGPVEVCDMASVWGGDVTVSDNMAEILVDQNIVRGDLTGEGNDPAPTVGDMNRVRGELGGQFAAPAEEDAAVAPQELQKSVARMAASPMRAAAPEVVEAPTVESVTERQEETVAEMDARQAEAEAKAVAAGPADLV